MRFLEVVAEVLDMYLMLDLLVLVATSGVVLKALSMSIPRAPAPLLDRARGAAYRARYRRDEGGPRSNESLDDGEERLVGTIRARTAEPVFALEIGQRHKFGARWVPTLAWSVWMETDRQQPVAQGDFVLETPAGDSYRIDVDAETRFVPTFVEASRRESTRRLRGELAEGAHVIVYGTIDRSGNDGSPSPYRDTPTKIVGRVHGAPNAPMIVADAKIGPGQLALWSGPGAVPERNRSALYGERLMYVVAGMVSTIPATLQSVMGTRVPFVFAAACYGGLVLTVARAGIVSYRPYLFPTNPYRREKVLSTDVASRDFSWAQCVCVSRWMVAQRAPLHSPRSDDAQMKAMEHVPFGATT